MLTFLVLASAAAAPTLAEYMDAAERNNPRAAIARADTDTARAESMKAGSELLPDIRANAAYTYNQYEAVVEGPDPDDPGELTEFVIVPQDQTDASITARVPLLDGPAWATWRALKNGARAAESDERAAIRDLRLDVARAWYEAIAAQEVIAAAERAKAAAEENFRYLSTRAKAGAATELSVQRAELEVANAERVLIDGRRAWLNARRTLATLSGLPEPESLPIVPADVGPAPEEDALLAAAEKNRPEIAAAQSRVSQFRLAKRGSWFAWTPSVDAVATERYSNASGFTGEETTWSAGVQLEWRLLDFGDRVGDVRRARAALTSAEATLRNTRASIRDEVHAAWLEVDATRAKVVAARRGATVALATAREVQTRFQAGTATQLDVIQAERDALDAEVARIRAEGELSVARLALQRAAGEPVRP